MPNRSLSEFNLFCLPFAGANKYSYNRYKAIAPDRVNVIPLELPGRGGRHGEELLTDMASMTGDLLAQVIPHIGRPYVFWGHSMGAILGYLMIKELIFRKLPQPIHLFITACRAPGLKTDAVIYHQLPKAQFLEELKKLGGSPEEILQDEEVMNFYEPIIRADFKAVETFAYSPTQPFSIPITAMIGQSDKVKREDALAWRTETDKELVLKEFAGGHFFIFDHEELLMKMITRCVLC